MQRIGVVFALALVADAASARPGFYVGLGGGGSSVSGESRLPEDRFGPDENGLPIIYAPGFAGVSTDTSGGPLAMFRLGFNVLGYAALEALATAHGTELTDEDMREWAAHAHLGLRAYPLWHWQQHLPGPLQPLEPSLFFGWGVSYQSYVPVAGGDPVGWEDWGSFRFGLGLEYFLVENFKVGLDWNWVRASYDTFLFNAEEGITFPAEPPVTTTYQQFIVSVAFQFGAAQRTVRYTPEPAPAPHPEPAPAPQPEPAPPPVIDG